MPDEPRQYTLDVARKILARQICADEGHRFEQRPISRTADGRRIFHPPCCALCDVDITLTYPPLEGA